MSFNDQDFEQKAADIIGLPSELAWARGGVLAGRKTAINLMFPV